ncbi:primosomal protein N' [Candidatus Saccharibacteria bacterium]|nr:primosomal protein N' [Candidatus Saccharibacteria bacterium]
MTFYEVWPADSRYHSDKPLTYSYDSELPVHTVVSVPLQKRTVSGFIKAKVGKPAFAVKPISGVLSQQPLPEAYFKLAEWMQAYYCCSLGDALRQLAPPKPSIRKVNPDETEILVGSQPINIASPLTKDQSSALKAIKKSPSTTILLHGETGSGKTRVYLELAKDCLKKNQSVVFLTPEISLTAQLEQAALQLNVPVYVFHSKLGVAQRKKIWLAILESSQPVVVIGPRSALFSPIQKLGLIVVDEAHEPAYKQDQTPRYQTSRVASQLGQLSGAKVILGTATPLVADYYLASQRKAVARMSQPAVTSSHGKAVLEVVDIKKRENFSRSQYLSKPLIDAITIALQGGKQTMIYLNKRGSARVILCNNCGWQLLCPNCDVPLIYHGDSHTTRCHICGHTKTPPTNCPQCKNEDIIYKSIGVKALVDELGRLFRNARTKRFDSDNQRGEHLSELYPQLVAGEVDILVGTQLLAKGLDLPKLGLVGIIAAESSLSLPDYSGEERSFQLLYQVMGRVGRGHSAGRAIIQTYEPDSIVVRAAMARDYNMFYEHCLAGRQKFRFPPFSYLLKLTCRRSTFSGAENASKKLMTTLRQAGLPVEIIGPAASFYGRRAGYYYWQIVVKSKNRGHLVNLAKLAPADWTIDLDPTNLL